jgi:hypothetical protein
MSTNKRSLARYFEDESDSDIPSSVDLVPLPPPAPGTTLRGTLAQAQAAAPVSVQQLVATLESAADFLPDQPGLADNFALPDESDDVEAPVEAEAQAGQPAGPAVCFQAVRTSLASQLKRNGLLSLETAATDPLALAIVNTPVNRDNSSKVLVRNNTFFSALKT